MYRAHTHTHQIRCQSVNLPKRCRVVCPPLNPSTYVCTVSACVPAPYLPWSVVYGYGYTVVIPYPYPRASQARCGERDKISESERARGLFGNSFFFFFLLGHSGSHYIVCSGDCSVAPLLRGIQVRITKAKRVRPNQNLARLKRKVYPRPTAVEPRPGARRDPAKKRESYLIHITKYLARNRSPGLAKTAVGSPDPSVTRVGDWGLFIRMAGWDGWQ
ncbi:hypothetical protein BT67DRAFT_5027 [Trichocladium antarcticum]|uniref:Uncharacterized protein n=1 Tax=Trichocladium antarcticum TaxID=1450529 RepID=A0AAN6UUV7_9PEZI|nr:hypothetical protein BT67DRAFT_5027 [Trichocladium antarcticum]